MQTPQHGISGLSRLVEAATALTELVEPQTAASSMSRTKPSLRDVVSDDDGHRRQKATSQSRMRDIFPLRLMEILSDPSLSEVISWLPHGRSFVITRPDILTDQVLSKYLPRVDPRASTKYPSFTRKLNRWGFRQATRGPDTGVFHHPLFRKEQPELCLEMVCQKSRERQSSQRRSLPLKKRAVCDTSASNESGLHQSRLPVSSLDSNATSIASVSADERSIASFANSTASSSLSSQEALVPSTEAAVSAGKDDSGINPYISNDSTFVANTLRQRDTIEFVRAAKAMLYDAYMKAMRGEGVES